MKKLIPFLLVAPLFLVSCGWWSWADYMAIHKDGIQKLEPARQINEHYKEVDNFIVDFGSRQQPMEWQTVAFFDGRFELTFVVPITVDYSKRTVTQAGQPRFLLTAVQSIRVLDQDRTESTDAKLGGWFYMRDWTNFVASGYDLTTLGIPKDEIHPIPHWKEYVYSWRKDRVPIK